MIRYRADVAILGSGFAGSLTAMLVRRIGLRPFLIERGTHPRFTIGESTTPMANLLLGDLARRYDLPRILPLAKYGTWLRAYPKLPRGLKRGFCYFHHQRGQPFVPRQDHRNELLVCANPDEERGDTHWLRADFDTFLAAEAQSMGVPYLNATELLSIEPGPPWQLAGGRAGGAVEIEAEFVIDATGPAGVLARALGIEPDMAGVLTDTQAVFSHFEHVSPWQPIYAAAGGRANDHPFPCDRATLHHVFHGGWMWVIPFDNGVTSAGFVLDRGRPDQMVEASPEETWASLCGTFPSIAEQFARARPLRPLVATGRLQRRWRAASGDGWAMLPHSAYFLDPLHSAGIAHTMVGIQRLISILAQSFGQPSCRQRLAEYDRRLRREIEHLDRILHGCYATFGRFELFSMYAMIYFFAATFTEHRFRDGAPLDETGYLLAADADFRRLLHKSHADVCSLAATAEPRACREFADGFARAMTPYNVAGLCDPAKHNMYHFA